MDLPVESLPAQFAAAGVLILNRDGHVLLVRTHNRDALVLPGGLVESGESPAAAAEREVAEELGLQCQISRLLVVQHKPASPGRPASLMFTFDTALVLDSSQSFRLQPEEIAEALWLPPTEAVRQHTPGGQARLEMALQAHTNGTTIYTDTNHTTAA